MKRQDITKLESEFAAVTAEHTAAAELTQQLANKRADLFRKIRAEREGVEIKEPEQPAEPAELETK